MKVFRGIGRLALIAALSASFLLWGQGNSFGDDCKRVSNILILFDASGYMKKKETYESLLSQMRFFEKAIPVTADGFFNVGLRHWGLKVGMGCETTEGILGIQPWDPERFLNAFPRNVSYGVSSLAAGLRAAADDVSAASGKSAIIVIGAGVESCSKTADPIKIAERIASNNPDLEIHTFQIGNEQEGRFYLKGIANAARGTYNHSSQFGSPAEWYGWMKKNLIVSCGPSAPTPLSGGRVGGIPVVVFDQNSTAVRSKDPAVDAANKAALAAVAAALKTSAAARLVIHGYSDSSGKPEQNLLASRKRAEAVAKYLMSTHGISSSQLGIMAHGAVIVQPGVPGPPGRRVELELVQ